AAMSLLNSLNRGKDSDFVFPGFNKGKPLSNMAMLELLRGMAANGYTVHGFRSTFRDWAGDDKRGDTELSLSTEDAMNQAQLREALEAARTMVDTPPAEQSYDPDQNNSDNQQ